MLKKTKQIPFISSADKLGERKDRSAAPEEIGAEFPFPFPFAASPVSFPGNTFDGGPSLGAPSNTFVLAAERSCWTTEGRVGSCTSVRTCYPKFKLPELSNLETWVIGTRGTCHYVEPDGRQVSLYPGLGVHIVLMTSHMFLPRCTECAVRNNKPPERTVSFTPVCMDKFRLSRSIPILAVLN